jgi:hypothetical protein
MIFPGWRWLKVAVEGMSRFLTRLYDGPRSHVSLAFDTDDSRGTGRCSTAAFGENHVRRLCLTP